MFNAEEAGRLSDQAQAKLDQTTTDRSLDMILSKIKHRQYPD